MSGYLGDYPTGAMVYVPFHTFDSNGSSITLTGLAVTDIEIYKNGGTTQRSSDAGYTLLDTDGIDFDAITGIHGFKVDLSDNTDAGFFAAGGEYFIVIASVTVDTRTVNFVAGSFSIERTGGALAILKAIGATGTGLTAIPWNAAWDAEVQSEATDALNAYDPPTNTEFEARSLAAAGYASPTNITGGVITTVTNLTNAPSAGDLTATMKTSVTTAATASTPVAASVTGAVGSVTGLTASDVGAIKAKTDNLPSDPADQSLVIAATNAITSAIAALNNLSAAQVNSEADAALADAGVTTARMGALTDWIDGGRLDLILDSRASQTGVDDLPTNAELATALGTADDATLAQIALIKAKTDLLPSDPADQSLIITATDAIIAAIADKTGYRLSAAGVNDVLRTALTESYAADGAAMTLEQSLHMIWSMLCDKAIVGTTLTTKKLNGTTAAMTFTLAPSGDAPTSQVRAT